MCSTRLRTCARSYSTFVRPDRRSASLSSALALSVAVEDRLRRSEPSPDLIAVRTVAATTFSRRPDLGSGTAWPFGAGAGSFSCGPLQTSVRESISRLDQHDRDTPCTGGRPVLGGSAAPGR